MYVPICPEDQEVRQDGKQGEVHQGLTYPLCALHRGLKTYCQQRHLSLPASDGVSLTLEFLLMPQPILRLSKRFDARKLGPSLAVAPVIPPN